MVIENKNELMYPVKERERKKVRFKVFPGQETDSADVNVNSSSVQEVFTPLTSKPADKQGK